ncbi:hypothetical protein V6N11_048337 [Hibiscus sabdariffa]|uniref:Gnk2-homologous domain-containing protein n=1 Tax=Hibiscus sabdariffa TaxID=183260 RepID=A0ABR2PUZ2_9ROSI
MFKAMMKLLLLVLVLSLFGPIAESQQPTYLSHACLNATTFAVNSTYQANRDALLSSLSSNGSRASGFHNTTAGSSPDMVYGLFLCRGDLSTSVCRACVTFAATDISHRCPIDKKAVVWYEECLLRYSDQNIFSVVTEAPTFFTYNSTQNVTQPERFNLLAGVLMNETARAAKELTDGKKFETGEVSISALQKLYTLAQCTPDLSVTDCNQCLQRAIGYLPTGRLGGRFLNPSCNFRIEFYPFYNLPSAVAVPEESKQNKSSRIPVLVTSLSAISGLVLVSALGFLVWRRRNNQVVVLSVLSPATEAQLPNYPNYLNHDCRNTTTFPVNSRTYRANRDSVLSLLSSNGNHETGFYNTTAGRIPNMVYGLFLCRGDVSSGICQACVIIAASNISQLCPVEISAVIWYDECLLRYSNQNIFSALAEEPSFSMYGIRDVSQEVRFNQLATALVVMNVTATRAANAPSGSEKIATEEAQFSSSPTVYTLVQCTPDLSSSDCNRCLQGAIANLSDCCNGRQGGRVLKPSCTVRYDVDPFYGQTAVWTTPPPTQGSSSSTNFDSFPLYSLNKP